jgi:hypothetical protein
MDAPKHISPSYKPATCCPHELHCIFGEHATAEEPCWGKVQVNCYEAEDGDVFVHVCRGHADLVQQRQVHKGANMTTQPPVPMPELLPVSCPWCGVSPEPYLHSCLRGDVWRIHHVCETQNRLIDIDVGGSKTGTREECVLSWNARAPSPSVPISEEMVEAALSATVPLYYEDDRHEARVGDFITPGIHKTNNERAIMRAALSAALSIQNKELKP